MKRISIFPCACLLAFAVPALAQQSQQTADPYGRTLDRQLKAEEMVFDEKELKAEKSELDKYSVEQRERMALAMVVFEPGESGEFSVDLKVRRGGEAAISMKGVRFDLEPKEHDKKWAVTSSNFEQPKKWKPLKIVVTPPGQPGRRVLCTGTKRIASGERLVFAILPLTTSGDFYCLPPHQGPEQEVEQGP